MSELEYKMICPFCNKVSIFLFAGSGKKGTCMECGKHLPEEKSYNDFDGVVLSYNG